MLAQQPGAPLPTFGLQINAAGTDTLAVSTTSNRVALSAPTAPTLWVSNPSANTVCVAVGNGSVVAAFAAGVCSGTPVPPGAAAVPVGIAGNTNLAGVTLSGTATLTIREGNLVPITGATPIGSVIVKPTVGAGAYAPYTVGTVGAALSAPTPTLFLDVHNASASATVCIGGVSAPTISGTQCAPGGTAGSWVIPLPPGWHKSWENSFVPIDALYAVASAASTPVTIGVK